MRIFLFNSFFYFLKYILRVDTEVERIIKITPLLYAAAAVIVVAADMQTHITHI